MLHRILLAALVAGFVAGIATSVLQHFTTTPLILEAEKYEGGGAAAVPSGVDRPAGQEARLIPVHEHPEGEEPAWAPADGIERTLSTSVMTVVTAFGFALVLLSAMILAAAPITARSGLLWGLGGFAAAGLAPALGLSPELPGAAAAELGARQIWWLGTAAATAVGLWLVLRVSTLAAIAGGIVLMVLPHVVGAPHPEGFASGVPAELSARFAAASLAVHAVTWVLAGAVAGHVWQRAEARQAAAATA